MDADFPRHSKKTIAETTRWQSATGGGPAFAGAPIPRVTREATVAEPEVRSRLGCDCRWGFLGFWCPMLSPIVSHFLETAH